MSGIGIVVEGLYDEAIVRALARAIVPGIGIRIRRARGRGNLLQKAPGLARELFGRTCQKVLVLVDSNGDDPSDLRNTVQNRMGSLPSVRVVIAIRAIEAWLLADPKVCESDYENPEDVLNPKEELKRRLRSRGIDYIPKIAERLAEELDV